MNGFHRSMRRGAPVAGLAFGILVADVLGGTAAAQVFPLGTVPGNNALQQRIGTSVQTTCQGLAQISPTGQGFTPAQQDLQTQCNAMVGNALQVQGTTPPAQLGTYGLDATQLNQALLQVSNDEAGAIGMTQNQVAFVQAAALQQRFFALRDGATGISVAGLPRVDGAQGFSDRAPWLRQDAASGDASKLPEGLGVFLTANGNWGHFGGSSEQLGFNSDSWGITGGVDYRFTDELVAGVAFGYVGARAGFTGGNGHLDRDSYIPSLYASYTHGGFYADALFSYNYDAFDLTRRINYANIRRAATGDTHGNAYSGSLSGGYDFDLKDVVEGLTLGPHARFDYVNELVSSFTESGASGLDLRYKSYQIESAVSGLGAQATYAISTGFGVLTPQLSVDWGHEFAAAPARVKASFAADPNQVVFYVRPARLNRDFARLGVGIVGTFAHGISAFVDWQTVLGIDSVQSNTVHLGGRYEF